MDRMYRFQRHFYDFTRKYYLLGRDRLLAELDIWQSERVLEIGCGTGRNLIILAKRYPEAHFYGLDASAAMLETAAAKIGNAKLTNVTLRTALANSFSYSDPFALKVPFDKIFFSYSLSMIPVWRESIENAIENLKPSGELLIVDFYDQKDLPIYFGNSVRWWLRQFHVKYPPELVPHLKNLQSAGNGGLTVTPLYRRYAFLTVFRKSP